MDTKRAKKIYAELEDLVIHLPSDPSGLGPDYLREQISICRGYLNTASFHLQKILQEKHLLSMQLDGLKAAFQVQSDDLLANDVRVKNLPAVEDRLAMINVILASDAREIKRVESELSNLGHVEKVVRLRKGELDNTMSAIRLQRSLLKDQLRTGSFYGDESNQGRGSADPVDEMDGADLDAILDEAEAELAGTDDSVVDFNEDEDEEEDGTDSEDEDSADSEEEVVVEDPPKKSKPEAKAEPKSEEADLLDEIEDLMGDDDIDETVPLISKEPVEEAAPQDVGEGLKDNTNPLTEDDIDPAIRSFLEEDVEDDIDSLIADI